MRHVKKRDNDMAVRVDKGSKRDRERERERKKTQNPDEYLAEIVFRLNAGQ